MNQGFAIKLKYAKVRVFRPSSFRRFKKLNMLLERVTRKVHKWNDRPSLPPSLRSVSLLDIKKKGDYFQRFLYRIEVPIELSITFKKKKKKEIERK